MAYKAVIFDLDGTLVDTLADLSNSMNFALESLGQPQQSLGASQRMIGNGVGTFAKRALSAEKQDLAEELALRMRRHYFDNCLLKSRLYDGVAEMEVGAGWVKAQLYPQLSAGFDSFRQPCRQFILPENFNRSVL